MLPNDQYYVQKFVQKIKTGLLEWCLSSIEMQIRLHVKDIFRSAIKKLICVQLFLRPSQ